MRRLTTLLLGGGLALSALACGISLAANTPGASSRPTLVPTLPAAFDFGSAPEVSPIENADLVGLYRAVNPGVVSIIIFQDMGSPGQSPFPSGQGSGFVIDKQGHIVTNNHVVENADEIEVDFPSGMKAWASLVGTDIDSDLAVLNIDVAEEDLVPLPLGDSDQVQVGEFVVAIGNPFGLSSTLTVGIVSAIGRTMQSQHTAPTGGTFTAGDIIQTDAAINPGNSGGPLINVRGEVIGVNNAIRTDAFTAEGSAANSGVGFAVPVNIVRRVVPSLIAIGRYDYPYIGISSLGEEGLTLPVIETLRLPPDATGAYVSCVTAAGPAEKAGIQGSQSCEQPGLSPGGDLVIAIDGTQVRAFSDLLSYLVNHTSVGQTVTLTVVRGGDTLDIPVTLEARP